MKYTMTFTVKHPHEARALAAAAHVVTNDDGIESTMPTTARDWFELLFSLHAFLESNPNMALRSGDWQSAQDAIMVCNRTIARLEESLESEPTP